MLKVKLRHLNVLEGELNAASEDALRVSGRVLPYTFLRASCLPPGKPSHPPLLQPFYVRVDRHPHPCRWS